MTGDELIAIERATVAAFKDKRENDFTAHFSRDYVGVANDGVKTADGELAGLRALDLDSIEVQDAKASLPADHVGIVTYTMIVAGRYGEHPINGQIHASSVYVKQGDQWKVVLHTESMGERQNVPDLG